MDGPREERGDEPLIYVSDASAEAERLSSALRGRGYIVVEVPLAMLQGRVAAQPPALILCDVDAPGALEAMNALRRVDKAAGVDIVFLGEAGRTLDERADVVSHEGTGFFVRPVDSYALLRKVEALIGVPSSRGSSPPSVRPSPSRRPDVVAEILRSPVPSQGPPSEPPRSIAPPRRPTRLAPTTPSSEPKPDATKEFAAPALSSYLEGLLRRADERVAQATSDAPSGPAGPDVEAEVDAALPPDVLDALDEPLDDDDDSLSEGGSIGTGSGSGSDGTRNPTTRAGTNAQLSGALGTSVGATTTGSGRETALREPSPAVLPATEPPITPPDGRRRQSEIPNAPASAAALPDASSTTPPGAPRRAPVADAGVTRPPPAREGVSVDLPREFSLAPPLAPDAREVAPPEAQFLPLVGSPVQEPVRLGELVPLQVEANAPPAQPSRPTGLELGSSLGKGDALRALARAVRARFSGALAFEDDVGIRRVVLRDGDFSIAAAGIDGDSLVSFLSERGTLSAEIAKGARKLPLFGRHAGAALIAQGLLRQDELWPVLRGHAEWLIARILRMERGAVSVESEVPARLASEPAVFGGATGAEVLVEAVRRAYDPGQAIAALGGPSAQLVAGPDAKLLAECALGDDEARAVRRAEGQTVAEAAELVGTPDFAVVLLALAELGVIDHVAPSRKAEGAGVSPRDAVDDDAALSRISARTALVAEGDYFQVLGVTRDATSYDIRRAYVDLRREFDPSLLLTARTAAHREEVDTILEVLDEAYEILRDQVRRERYRRALESPPR